MSVIMIKLIRGSRDIFMSIKLEWFYLFRTYYTVTCFINYRIVRVNGYCILRDHV